MCQLQLDDDRRELRERAWTRIVKAFLESVVLFLFSGDFILYIYLIDAYGGDGESKFLPISVQS